MEWSQVFGFVSGAVAMFLGAAAGKVTLRITRDEVYAFFAWIGVFWFGVILTVLFAIVVKGALNVK